MFLIQHCTCLIEENLSFLQRLGPDVIVWFLIHTKLIFDTKKSLQSKLKPFFVDASPSIKENLYEAI